MIDKRIVYFILAAFITGTILLVFIQFNSAKNINALISGNEKLLNEFNVSNELKELESDVLSIESRIRGAVSINDSTMIIGLAQKTAEIRDDISKLQKVTDDDSSIRYIDQLEILVNLKLEFSQQIIDSFRMSGKTAAERVIRTKKGVVLTEGITDLVNKADRSRKKLLREVTMTIDDSGKKALRFSLILIIFVLISAAVLFWYIINIQ
ncbi:MAG: hypothetical protein EOO02_01725 [Chitinophagaceae bacterium]|nr:MAG: hypothetical protein EOO02_01725 [Chitinophagaceae bacterium]